METKKRTHKIFDRFTIPCAIALIVISTIVITNLGSLIGMPVKSMTGNEHLASAVGMGITSLLVLWLFKFCFPLRHLARQRSLPFPCLLRQVL